MYDYLERYALEREIRSDSVAQLRYCLNTFGEFLGHCPASTDFTDDAVNRFILWLTGDGGYAEETARSRRRGLLTIWRAAAEDGVLQPPRKVRKMAPHYSVPRAWTEQQVALICAECDQLCGSFRRFPHIQRSTFAKAAALAMYETGFRRGDLLRIQRFQIQPDGLIVLVQSKTGQPHLARIRPETLALIDQTAASTRPRVFGGVVSARWLSRLLDRVYAAAGITEGSTKWFRRSGATHAEKAAPGTGWKYLGHTTPRIAHRSYIDPLQTGSQPFMPPKLPPPPDQKAG